MAQAPDLVPCNEPGPITNLNIDLPPEFCREGLADKGSGTIDKKPFFESQVDVAGRDLSWLEDATQHKLGHGQSALCDPQTTGHIINEQGLSAPNRDVIYRYGKSLRGTDEGVKSLFSDIVVIDDSGKAHQVPIIWATQEKAVAYILQNNVRKDEGLVVDRIRLPILAINSTSYNLNQKRYTYHKAIDYLRTADRDWKPGFTVNEKYERDTIFGVSRGIPVDIGYTLYAWTKFEEDMNQIKTQIMTKMFPMGYIRVRGVAWEICVKLDSVSSSVNVEPGDQAERIFKYQFGLTAETYVVQPIVRKKAVLKTKVEIANHTEADDITDILTRLEDAVKELE